MRCGSWTIGAALLAGVMIGCGKSEADQTAADASAAGQASTGAQAGESNGGPAEAVHAFLKAVRDGKDDEANGMLTKLAREETAKMNMVVAPPGSDTATFEVGEVELLSEGDEQGAHVASKWTDVGDDGQPHTDEIIWMLRKEPEGWRIAGMATTVFEGEPPLLLNFENPKDMQRKQQLAEEEMQRRMRAELSGEMSAEVGDSDKSAEASDARPTRQAQRGRAPANPERE
jgi:hypothetical protein